MRTAIIILAVMALLLVGKGSADCNCEVGADSQAMVCDTEGNAYPSVCELECEGKKRDTSKTFNSKTGDCE